MGNQIRTTILLAVMTALILWIGQVTKSGEDRRQADAKVFWDRLSGK